MDIANRLPVRVALDMLDARPGERILDAGCGTGETLRQLLCRATCEVAGIDPSPVMIAAARKKLANRAALTCSTIEAALFPDESFNGILALNVLYFCGEDGAMLAALHRMLRPGGRLVVYVSHRETMENWSFAQTGVHRLYNEAELSDALHGAGFAPSRIMVQSGPVARNVTGLWASATR